MYRITVYLRLLESGRTTILHTQDEADEANARWKAGQYAVLGVDEYTDAAHLLVNVTQLDKNCRVPA